MFLLDYIQNTGVNTKTINRNDARECIYFVPQKKKKKKIETCRASDDFFTEYKTGCMVWGQSWNFV